MEPATRQLVENAYYETVDEAPSRPASSLDAHKEGIVAASMLLAALSHKLGWPESEMDIRLPRCASSPLSVTASLPISGRVR